MLEVKGLASYSPLGHLNEFRKDPLHFLSDLYNKHDTIVSFRFAHRKMNLLLEPALIKEVLVTKQNSFHKSKPFQEMKTLLGEGLLTSEDEVHMRQRRLMQPSFTKQHIQTYAEEMTMITEEFLCSWKDGEERLISRDMMELTLAIIVKTMFSMDMYQGHERVGKHLDIIMDIATKRIRSVLKAPLALHTPQNKSLTEAINAIDKVLYEMIEKRSDSNIKEDLLGVLMRARDEESGEGMTNQQLRDEAMTIFMAGHETTANTLSWCLYLLSQHPSKAERLYEEVDRVLGNRRANHDDMKELVYTQQIIWESIRLYPPAWLIGRKAIEDVRIGNYKIHKGETVLISPYIMQHSEKYFSNAEEFIPERFINGKVKDVPEYAFFPFGGGPRVCIGNHFAIMEATLVLATIAQQFTVELLQNQHKVEPEPFITLRPKSGLRMIVRKRR
ncbi:cytochrome P450 [Gottfriedia luciferensis]|uniref:cytochrome P450 n=1 Tax=Gottfriedia luciferensis TaxID=178774 RepID=UPI000B454DC7|nr:cytochrome P450 [Gottfriedia luciferensis]